jgi:hypothetical protein
LHVDTFVLVATWLVGIASGAVLYAGIVRLATGRPAINLSRRRWSAGENTALGACATIQGATLAAYGLIGGLTLGSHSVPVFWAGHWWGLFATLPFAVIIFGTVYVQTYLRLRHEIGRRTLPL